MSKKKTFTNGLIAFTFVLGLTLSLFGVYAKSRNTEIVFGDEEWSRPIFSNTVKINWPEVSGEALSKSIESTSGYVNSKTFENIFKNEFINGDPTFDIDSYNFECKIIDDIIEIDVWTDLNIYEGLVIENKSHKYRYQYIVN